jgi:hypothetical protein
MIVYHIAPTPDLDLYRYYDTLDLLKRSGFVAGLSQIWSSSDPLSYSLLFIVASIFNNHAVTLMAALIDYSVFFYMIFDYSKERKLGGSATGAVLIFFLAAYNVVNSFTGIRFALGVSLFLIALYLDVVKKRRLPSILLYVISPLLHTSMITLLMLRVAAGIFRKKSSIFQYCIVFVAGLSTAFLQQISQVLSSVPFLDILSSRADVYLQPIFPSGLWYPFNIIVTLMLVVILFRMRKKDIINPVLLKVNLFVFIIALANIMNFYIANRYIIVGILLFTINSIDIAAYLRKHEFFATRRVAFYFCFSAYILVLLGYFGYQVMFLIQMNYENLNIYSLLENAVGLLGR